MANRMVARVGDSLRAEIDDLSRKWRLGNAETVRRLVVLGIGGDMNMADALNAGMREKMKRAEERYGRKREPGTREANASGEHAPIVTVRLPLDWIKAVKREGGLKEVLQRGLGRV